MQKVLKVAAVDNNKPITKPTILIVEYIS